MHGVFGDQDNVAYRQMRGQGNEAALGETARPSPFASGPRARVRTSPYPRVRDRRSVLALIVATASLIGAVGNPLDGKAAWNARRLVPSCSSVECSRGHANVADAASISRLAPPGDEPAVKGSRLKRAPTTIWLVPWYDRLSWRANTSACSNQTSVA